MQNKTQSKAKSDKVRKMIKKGEETKRIFGLDEGEIEDIFDIIAKENPEIWKNVLIYVPQRAFPAQLKIAGIGLNIPTT